VGASQDAKLQPIQIKTGISDGIFTEVLTGLDENAQVVTGVAIPGAQAQAQAPRGGNPFGGGGFPRGR
jgi:HlyD family secretion protein